MTVHTFHYRVHPLASGHTDPITGGDDALQLLLEAVGDGSRSITVILLVCSTCRGVCLLTVVDPDRDVPDRDVPDRDVPDRDVPDRDVVVDAVGAIAALALDAGYDALVVASVRPGASLDLDDLPRWVALDRTCADAGVELVEWFVVGSELVRPREWCGVPARWAQ